MIAVVIALSIILLLIAFRSVVVPLISALMNLLSVAAAYGVLTFVFQEGHGASLIGVDGGATPIVSYVPLMMFAILFGLSMDYQVFLMSRMREHFERTGDVHEVVVDAGGERTRHLRRPDWRRLHEHPQRTAGRRGVRSRGRIAIDATIVRCVLVPSVMVPASGTGSPLSRACRESGSRAKTTWCDVAAAAIKHPGRRLGSSS